MADPSVDIRASSEEKPIRKSGIGGLGKYFRFRGSSIARKIIAFNFLALCVLLLGLLYLNQSRGSVVQERQNGLIATSELYAKLLESRLLNTNANIGTSTETAIVVGVKPDVEIAKNFAAEIGSIKSTQLSIFTEAGELVSFLGESNPAGESALNGPGSFPLWAKAKSFFNTPIDKALPSGSEEFAANIAASVVKGGERIVRSTTASGQLVVGVGRSVQSSEGVFGTLVLSTPEGQIDGLLNAERNTIFRIFVLALLISVVLSFVLANSIAAPIHDLTLAAEAGHAAEIRKNDPDRVRIPDMTGRPDEIGRLSTAMRDMTSALYMRIDSNEQFAADVAHEIKNPLASLRSAVETLRIAPAGDKRDQLLDVLDHDIRRLDRLVSDISNASRLDAELVKEELETFDLTKMLGHIVDFHNNEADELGIELIWDKPKKPIKFDGLEARLAQVFVNLLTNAISFCETGDAIRIWIRKSENRILVVVEDTGPGIPVEGLSRIFDRFYSERDQENFGNHSGLGLSISRQIVEAHNGVIWAENIHGKDEGPTDTPLGARFVVGLPTS